MLSTNETSNLQCRRQQQPHRRQQSLEVPILATHLPAHQRQRSPQYAHRRGLSLDQSRSAAASPTGFQPDFSQDRKPPPSSPLAGTTSTTNTGHTYPLPGRQHYVQETQQHLPSQPGFPAQDFQTHLQQQLHGGQINVNPQQLAFQTAEDAKMQLQQHISWYQTTYGEGAPNITASTPPNHNITQANVSQMPMAPTNMTANLPMHGMPTPTGRFIHAQPQMSNTPHPHPQPHSHTVPNTPQNHPQPWSSPPQTYAKHMRSQSYQLDTVPMSTTFGTGQGDFVLADQGFSTAQGAYPQDSFSSFGTQQSYASSAYSSSAVDPSSPPQTFSAPHMPTLVEEPTFTGLPGPQAQQPQQAFADNALLVPDTAGGADNQDDQFLYQPQAMSPRAAALASLGGINASIEDTGVTTEQVSQYMSEQSPSDNKWTCLYPDCSKRFGRKENIRAHVQTHLGDRQFKCNDCGKKFVRQHDLKRHAKIHIGTKPHACPCGQSFARQDALTRHRQRGTCTDPLPGFEKSEEDKKKRGRPRKERPDTKTRTQKSTRARHMDAMNNALSSDPAANRSSPFAYDNEKMPPTDAAIDDLLLAADEHYASASSDSGASDYGLPVTPPDTQSDLYEEFEFNNFVNATVDNMGDLFDFSSVTGSSPWNDGTPPSSPPEDYSSPIDALSPPGNCLPQQEYLGQCDLTTNLMAFLEHDNAQNADVFHF